VLRPYQTAAVNALWAYWRAGGGNPLIDLATGLGKSFLIADLAHRFVRQDRRVLVLSHVREIIEQDCHAIRAVWPEAPIGINSAALGERNVDAPTVLATVQSVFRNPQALGPRSLVMVDESHLVPHRDEGMYRATIAGLRELAELRVAGFTATPYRLDSGRLDEGEGRLFDRVVYNYGIADGVRDGWLTPLVSNATDAEINVAGVARRGGEFVAGELEAAADDDELVARAVEEIIAYGAGRRQAWLCFCCGVDHAFHVRDALRERGVACEAVTGTTPAATRRETIDRFHAGRLTCLTNCNVFTTGFDVPSVDLIAMLRPTLSPGLFVQMMGRGTRKADGKQNCLVLDFGGNVARHGPVDTVTGEECTGVRARGDGTKVCPGCKSIIETGTPTCPDCGYAWPVQVRRPQHAAIATGLSPLGGNGARLAVRDVNCSVHQKPGRPPLLRLDFWTSERRVSDFLAFEHSSGARWHAARKWRALGGRNPVPQTTAEAYARRTELRDVAAIGVEHEGGYWRVTGFCLEAS
jgi:DNA repair protein RadD